MTGRHIEQPAFSIRKSSFVKTHALWLLRTKNIHFVVLRFQDFQRLRAATNNQLLTCVGFVKIALYILQSGKVFKFLTAC